MGQYPKKGSDSTWFARVELGIPAKKKSLNLHTNPVFAIQCQHIIPVSQYLGC
jgi:hypothetical protein